MICFTLEPAVFITFSRTFLYSELSGESCGLLYGSQGSRGSQVFGNVRTSNTTIKISAARQSCTACRPTVGLQAVHVCLPRDTLNISIKPTTDRTTLYLCTCSAFTKRSRLSSPETQLIRFVVHLLYPTTTSGSSYKKPVLDHRLQTDPKTALYIYFWPLLLANVA